MNLIILLLLAIVVLETVGIFILFSGRCNHPLRKVTSYEHTEALKNIFSIQENLTAVQWHIDIALSKDSGKLNLSQQEMLHQIKEQNEQAILELDTTLKNLRSSIKSSALSKKAKNEI